MDKKLTVKESIYKSANNYIATIVCFILFLLYGVILVTLIPFLVGILNLTPHIDRIDFYVENYAFWLIIILSIVSLILVLFSFFFIKKLVNGNKAFKYIHLTKKE